MNNELNNVSLLSNVSLTICEVLGLLVHGCAWMCVASCPQILWENRFPRCLFWVADRALENMPFDTSMLRLLRLARLIRLVPCPGMQCQCNTCSYDMLQKCSKLRLIAYRAWSYNVEQGFIIPCRRIPFVGGMTTIHVIGFR